MKNIMLPDSTAADIAVKAGKISSVELLGYRKKLDWQQTSEGLSVRIPRRAVNELKTYAFKVKFE